MDPVFRTALPYALLLTLRPTELWTPLTVTAASVLLVVAVAALAWWVAVATAGHDDGSRGGAHRRR